MAPDDPEDTKDGDDRAHATNGAAHAAPSDDALDHPDDDDDEEDLGGSKEEAPTRVLELAASCVRFVLAKYKVELDGTPETLSILDHYIREARAELPARPEGLELLQATVGAYLGEVMRGVFDASWRCEGEHEDWRLRMRRVFLTFNPLGMAREALTLEDAPGWHAHVEVDPGEEEEVARRLAVLPEVTEEEFYAPSTRFDVLELTFTAVRASMRAAGLDDVIFTDEDYEA